MALGACLAAAVGGSVALRSRDQLHLVLGFTAGVLLGVVAFELLPEVFRLAGDSRLVGIPTVMIAFAGGYLFLHVVERSIALHSGQESEYAVHAHRHPSLGLIGALALLGHSFLDGVGIGLGFHVGRDVGLAVAVAVVGHRFADGLNTVSIMLMHGNTVRRSLFLLVLGAVAPVFGAASTLLFTVPDRVIALYLAYFAGFLLYLATSQILPEAHSGHPSGWTLGLTMAGVAVIWAVVAIT